MRHRAIRSAALRAVLAQWAMAGAVGALALAPLTARAQQPRGRAKPPVVAVLPFRMASDSAHADTTAIEQGIAALLEAELASRPRVRIAKRAASRPPSDAFPAGDTIAATATRARGAAYGVLGNVRRAGDSVRVTARVVRARGAEARETDEVITALDDIPTLVAELADAVVDSIAPTSGGLRGPPLFRPPRPSVPFAAMALYSKAVTARAAGDADTAAKLLRQASSLAPQWEQPKRDLVALRRRS